jgi:rhodanese-related sulfurtransferase
MLLFGTAVITGGMLLWPLVSRPLRAGSEVGPFDAVQLINRRDAAVIDVRDASDYAAGHIANARHVPENQVAQRLKELDKLKPRPVLVACRTGARAAAVANILRKNGFEAVALRGGVAAWQQAGLPLQK